jgi:ATP-binding cassette subfamily F protein 3
MLTISSLTYRIGGRDLLQDASARVARGRRIGLVGRNGSGKTTLLRLISGTIEPDGGALALSRGANVATVSQEAPGGTATPIEIVLAAHTERHALLAEAETADDAHRIAEIQTRLNDIGAHAAPSRAASILAGLGIGEAAQNEAIQNLSGGWRMRVALAAALFAEPDLLLLDEPTNHLDLEATMWLENYLRNYPRTLLLVSHDRHILNAVPDGILHLENCRLTLYPGGYDNFARTYGERRAAEAANQSRQAAKRRKLEGFVARFRYNASKARQAQSRLKALQRLGEAPPSVDSANVEINFPDPEGLAPPLITFSGVAAGYVADTPVLKGLDLRLDPDDRIALLGANGNGKSTFAKLLARELQPMAGEIFRAAKMRVGYFAQHQIDTLEADETAFQQLGRVMAKAAPHQVRARLGTFGFSQDKANVVARDLSGGEKARLNLALISYGAPQILVLDEPTNHLDLETRDSLVQALNAFPGAVVVISHDWDLLELTVERLWLVADGTVRPYDGDLDDYRRQILGKGGNGSGNGSGKKPAREKPAKGKTARRGAADERAKRTPLKRAAESAEFRLNKATRHKTDIEAKMADTSLYEGAPERLVELGRKLSAAERAIADAEADWLQAAEALEALQAEEGD